MTCSLEWPNETQVTRPDSGWKSQSAKILKVKIEFMRNPEVEK